MQTTSSRLGIGFLFLDRTRAVNTLKGNPALHMSIFVQSMDAAEVLQVKLLPSRPRTSTRLLSWSEFDCQLGAHKLKAAAIACSGLFLDHHTPIGTAWLALSCCMN